MRVSTGSNAGTQSVVGSLPVLTAGVQATLAQIIACLRYDVCFTGEDEMTADLE